jgi:peptidoglycan/LPS O-acetylase OafA/YrhL
MIPANNMYYKLAFILVLSPVIVAVGSQAAFNVKVSAYLGVSSYCIYAIHDPLLMLSAGMANRFHFPVDVIVLLAIVAILVAAPILDRFYDRPVRAVLSSLQRHGGRSPAFD